MALWNTALLVYLILVSSLSCFFPTILPSSRCSNTSLSLWISDCWSKDEVETGLRRVVKMHCVARRGLKGERAFACWGGGGGTVHWKQGYRGQFHIFHWKLLLFCFSDEIKVRIQYFKVVFIHFMSDVWLKGHFPQKSFVIWWKISIFDTKNLIPRYSTTFQLPNYLILQIMYKIQLFGYGKIQAKQI